MDWPHSCSYLIFSPVRCKNSKKTQNPHELGRHTDFPAGVARFIYRPSSRIPPDTTRALKTGLCHLNILYQTMMDLISKYNFGKIKFFIKKNFKFLEWWGDLMPVVAGRAWPDLRWSDWGRTGRDRTALQHWYWLHGTTVRAGQHQGQTTLRISILAVTSIQYKYNYIISTPFLSSPHLSSPHLTSPHIPHLTSPLLPSPHLISSLLTSPHLISLTILHG